MKKIYILFLIIYFIGFIIQGSFCDLIEGMDLMGEVKKDFGKAGDAIVDGVGAGVDGAKNLGGAIKDDTWTSKTVDVQNLNLDPSLQNHYIYVEYSGDKAPEWQDGAGAIITDADMLATLDDMRTNLGITYIHVGDNPDESISFYQYEVNFTTTKAGAFFFHPNKRYLDMTDVKVRVYKPGDHTVDYGAEDDATIVKIEKSAPLNPLQVF
jgi:hypothetical protein